MFLRISFLSLSLSLSPPPFSCPNLYYCYIYYLRGLLLFLFFFVFSRRNILLNYAVYNCRLGYTQGMSDLLAPLLAELNSEIEAFWCFAGLMQRSVAVCTPTDIDMDRNLCYLRELVRIMVPDFYTHLQKHADALELLFCHRWILLYVQCPIHIHISHIIVKKLYYVILL